MRNKLSLSDLYRFPGFRPKKTIHGIFGDSRARVITLVRRGKKLFVELASLSVDPDTIEKQYWRAIFPAETHAFISSLNYGASYAGVAAR